MAHTGVFNGFYFDSEIFTDYMEQESTLNNLMIDSGILAHDTELETALGSKGNVGTTPFFLPVDGEPDALNDDGKTNNVPTEISGGKQTFMAIARMKAWKENTYVRYLTGKSPLQNLADKLVIPYYKNQWEKVIYAILKGIMANDKMKNHKTDKSIATGSIKDDNKIGLTDDLDLGQKALGDRRNRFKVFICHSAVAKRLRTLELTENVKYFSEILNKEVEVTKYGGMILLETDTGTVDETTPNYPKYHSYMIGTGAILTCDKQVANPYDMKHDPETNGGVDKIYTKQAKVLHPNGFSIQLDQIAEESPTNDELAKKESWALAVKDDKLIPIAELITNG